MQRLEDVFIIENLQILNEDKSTGVMKIRGIFQRADEENNNKRVYPGKLLEREILKLQPLINERRLLGELDHPKQDTVSLSNVSHLITSIQITGKEVIGEAELLNTPMGNVAQALIKGGVKIGISSRGLGTLTEGEDGRKYVNEDFRLITWDIVADPSTRGAFPGLTESTEIQEIFDEILPKVIQNKVLRVVLSEAINSERTKRDSSKKDSLSATIKSPSKAFKAFRTTKEVVERKTRRDKRRKPKVEENKGKPIATDHRHYEEDIVKKESYTKVRESLHQALLEFDPKKNKKFKGKTMDLIQDIVFKRPHQTGAQLGKAARTINKERQRKLARGTGATKTSGPKGKLPK